MAFSPPKDFHALTRLVQAAIRDRYYGFAPPGSCILVPGLSPNDFSCKVISCLPYDALPGGIKVAQRHRLQHDVVSPGSARDMERESG